MSQRHQTFTLHGDPIVFSELGNHNMKIEAGKKYDFRDSLTKLYVGKDPSGIKNPTHQVNGCLIYIVFINTKQRNPNIGYRILTNQLRSNL